jgi:hypothetical protein
MISANPGVNFFIYYGYRWCYGSNSVPTATDSTSKAAAVDEVLN